MSPKEARELMAYLAPAEREELEALLAADITTVPWRPLPGPQSMAYYSEADVVGFGGAAGGGKTDLAIGLSINEHSRVQIFRPEGPQLTAIVDRLAEIVGGRSNIGGVPPVYRDGDRKIEFCSMPNLGDEQKYQGRPKDLLVIDEAANFLEQQVRFVKGWVRTTKAGQRTRTLMTFNPPTTTEGRWVIDFFAPWLDKKHPLYPTMPGHLRYVYVDPESGKDVWIDDDNGNPFVLVAGERCYDFDSSKFRPEEVIQPESRTFIPSRITDNPYLVGTGYMQQLQALPEPLRSQMLLGDFEAGMQDDPWQVIPTAWVDAAQARWVKRSPKGEMLAQGVDVARGGKDNTVIANRHKVLPRAKGESGTDFWFDELKLFPGKDTPDGDSVAGQVIACRRDNAPILIDVIGVGASPYDTLNRARQDVHGINVATKSSATDKSGKLTFFNLRSELWWKFRELLDPANDTGVMLPPDPELAKELCTPRWSLSGMTIKVEGRDEIYERIGRSVDRASAVLLAAIEMPKRAALETLGGRDPERDTVLNYDPMAHLST